MRNELEDSYAKIESLNKEINKIKEQLYENLDANGVVDMENELKNLKKEEEKYEEEVLMLKMVQDNQKKVRVLITLF